MHNLEENKDLFFSNQPTKLTGGLRIFQLILYTQAIHTPAIIQVVREKETFREKCPHYKETCKSFFYSNKM